MKRCPLWQSAWERIRLSEGLNYRAYVGAFLRCKTAVENSCEKKKKVHTSGSFKANPLPKSLWSFAGTKQNRQKVNQSNECLQYNHFDWKRSSGWLESWEGLLLVIDVSTSLYGSHLQSQVVVLVRWKFKNPGEQFDWSVDIVAVGKCVMWLAVKTCAEIVYANRMGCKMNNKQGVTAVSYTHLTLPTKLEV